MRGCDISKIHISSNFILSICLLIMFKMGKCRGTWVCLPRRVAKLGPELCYLSGDCFLCIPVTQKCQILSCDTSVANDRYVCGSAARGVGEGCQCGDNLKVIRNHKRRLQCSTHRQLVDIRGLTFMASIIDRVSLQFHQICVCHNDRRSYVFSYTARRLCI